MHEQTLYIDDMVCRRCLLAVERILSDAGWKVLTIRLGFVRAEPPVAGGSLERVAEHLRGVGLRLRRDGYNLVAQLKGIIIEHVYDDEARTDIPLSEIIVRQVDLSYSHVSRHFSGSESRTIEAFYQAHRIERAKRLMFQTNLSFKSIGKRLKYKSPGHFSTSFKKVVGETPSIFRGRGEYLPQSIDKL